MTDRPDAAGDRGEAPASDDVPSDAVPFEAAAEPAAFDSTDPSPVPFDPTGLDLARQIADAAGRTVPLPPPRAKARQRKAAPKRQGRGDPVPLGEALEDLIEDRGWSTEVNVQLLLGRWLELVGPAVAEHSVPESYAKGVVVVRTTSTNWATQLRLMAPQLLARLNASLGDGTITRLHIVGPQAPSWRKGPRTVRGGRGPGDTYG